MENLPFNLFFTARLLQFISDDAHNLLIADAERNKNMAVVSMLFFCNINKNVDTWKIFVTKRNNLARKIRFHYSPDYARKIFKQ